MSHSLWPEHLPTLPNEPGVLACRFLPDTTLIEVSDAYTEAFDRGTGPLVGGSFLNDVPAELHDQIRAWLKALTPRNPVQTYQHVVRFADGSKGTYQWTDRAIFDREGKLQGYESLGRDITTLEQTRAALVESQDRFRLIADNLREVFWVLDPMAQNFRYVSPAVSDVLGLVPGELYDQPELWLERVHPDDRETIEFMLLRVHEQDFDITYRVVTEQGKSRHVRCRGYPTGDGLAVGMLTDVTTEHRNFELARVNEERFQALMAGSMDAIYLFASVRDEAGQIVDFEFLDVNRRGAELISRSREDILGQRLCELIPINRTNGYFEEYRQVAETRSPFTDEINLHAKDQGLRSNWLQRQVIPLGDGVAIMTRDISQRKRDELEIAELYRQTQTILDAVPSYIYYKDAHNRILRVNRAAAESIGKPVHEIEGQSTEEFFPEDAAAYYKDDMAVMRSKQAKLGYVEGYDVAGQTKRYIQTDKVPMFDDAGEAIGVLAVATDVTERRKAEIKSNELELALQERRIIGHEMHDGIGQQLTGLRMLIESARKQNAKGGGVAQGTLDDLADIVANATGEVRRLINGLLPERIAPDELPTGLTKLAETLREQHGLEIGLELDADAEALGEVLTAEQADHLLMIAHEASHNAAKHAQATRLHIALQHEDGALTLEVKDDGRGIPEKPESAEGTGKGLTIMRHRADMIDASIQVFRPQRGGTAVRCVKPLIGKDAS